MGSEIEELKSLAKQAIAEGDEATAHKAMDRLDMLNSQQSDQKVDPQVRAQAEAEAKQAQSEADAINSNYHPSLLSGVENVGNAIGGFVGKAAHYGARALSPIDNLTDKVMGDRNPNISGLITGEQPKSRNQERVEGIDNAMSSLGYSPNSASYKVGSVATDMALTAPLGGMIAAPLKAVGVAAPLTEAIATGGMNAGELSGLTGIGIRTLGGAINGAAQSVVTDPTLKSAETGAVVGALAPNVLKPIAATAGALYRASKGAIDDTTEAGKLALYAMKNKLPLLTSDVFSPNNFVTKAMQATAEKIPFLGTGSVRAEQEAARNAIAKTLSDSHGVPSPDEVVESLKRVGEGAKAKAGENYKSIIDKMDGAEIPLTNTVEAIDKHIEKLTKGGMLGDDPTVKVLENIKSRLTSAPNDLQMLRENRTTLRTQFQSDSGATKDVADRALDDIYNGMTADMHAGVVSTLGDDASNLMRGTDTSWRKAVDQAKQTKIGGILKNAETAPDLAEKAIRNTTGQAELNILHNSLDEEGRRNARAIILQNAIFQNGKEGAENSATVFANKSNAMSRQFNTFFKGDDKKAAQGALDYINATRRAPDAAVSAPNGAQLLLPGAAAYGVHAVSPMLAAAIGIFAVGSRAYESPQVRNMLIRAASIPKNSTQFEKLTNKITETIAKNSAVPTTDTMR